MMHLHLSIDDAEISCAQAIKITIRRPVKWTYVDDQCSLSLLGNVQAPALGRFPPDANHSFGSACTAGLPEQFVSTIRQLPEWSGSTNSCFGHHVTDPLWPRIARRATP
jgi:hypothetical protein